MEQYARDYQAWQQEGREAAEPGGVFGYLRWKLTKSGTTDPSAGLIRHVIARIISTIPTEAVSSTILPFHNPFIDKATFFL